MDRSRETEVVDTNEPVEARQRAVIAEETADGRIVAKRVVWYIAGVIIALLALRVVMLMLGANREAGFVDFTYTISGVFAAPFAGIFPAPTYGGQFFFDSASIVAIIVYALVAWGIAKLFTLGSPREVV